MATKIPVLPVIFRAEKSGDSKGEVTAVFPTMGGTGAHDFTVYAHIGQHSSGTRGWYNQTRAARPDEYASLLSELRRIYERGEGAVKLRVTERFSSAHDSQRRREYGEPGSALVHESGNNPRAKKHPLDAAAVARIERAAAKSIPSRKRAPFTSAQRKQRGLAPLDAGLKSRIDKVLRKK